jgi:hypothetical protein
MFALNLTFGMGVMFTLVYSTRDKTKNPVYLAHLFSFPQKLTSPVVTGDVPNQTPNRALDKNYRKKVR